MSDLGGVVLLIHKDKAVFKTQDLPKYTESCQFYVTFCSLLKYVLCDYVERSGIFSFHKRNSKYVEDMPLGDVTENYVRRCWM
jgi:hypothetical protein